ncbi:MAG: DMP19 family protein [Bacteroidaceae bacterium]|nr:DMP19 family protein [Bacteroidaceae bacterium]
MEKNIIKDEDLQQASQEGMDAFIDVFVQAYLKLGDGQITAELMQQLNGDQLTLLAYHVFREEVLEGGFCQLIQNGYGPFIFENPFAKALRIWGLKELGKQVYKAREIYVANKADLTRERTDEEFMAMYEQYEKFDKIEEWYIEEEEALTGMIAYYVDEHIADFLI